MQQKNLPALYEVGSDKEWSEKIHAFQNRYLTGHSNWRISFLKWGQSRTHQSCKAHVHNCHSCRLTFSLHSSPELRLYRKPHMDPNTWVHHLPAFWDLDQCTVLHRTILVVAPSNDFLFCILWFLVFLVKKLFSPDPGYGSQIQTSRRSHWVPFL